MAEGHGARDVRFYLTVLAGMALCALASAYVPRGLALLPGLVGLGAWVFWPVYTGGRLPMNRVALAGVGVTVVLAVVSAVWAIDSGEALERAGKAAAVLVPGMLVVAAAAAVPREWLEKFWWMVPAAAGIAAVLLNIEYMTNMAMFRAMRGLDAAANLDMYELNRAAVAVALLMLPCAGMVYGHMRRMGAGAGMAWARVALYVALFVPAISQTKSQTAQMVFVVGLLMLLLFPVMWRRAWQALAVVLVAGLITAPFLAQYLFSLAPPPESVPVDGIWAWVREGNIFPRLEIWDYVSRYALQNPLTGFGIEATKMVEAFDNKELFQPGLTILHPHNGALQIWIEFGVIGAVLAAAGAWVMLTQVIARIEGMLGRRMAGASFAGAMLVALTSYGLWQGWWLGLVMLLAAVTVAGVRGLDVAGRQDA